MAYRRRTDGKDEEEETDMQNAPSWEKSPHRTVAERCGKHPFTNCGKRVFPIDSIATSMMPDSRALLWTPRWTQTQKHPALTDGMILPESRGKLFLPLGVPLAFCRCATVETGSLERSLD